MSSACYESSYPDCDLITPLNFFKKNVYIYEILFNFAAEINSEMVKSETNPLYTDDGILLL